MHFIHVNVNSLLSKMDEIRYIAKLINATIIQSSEAKLDDTTLSSEPEIEGYYLVRFHRCRRGGCAACFVKDYIRYNRRPNFFILIPRLFVSRFFCLKPNQF